MGKIAIVGCEASGKTVFMAALADHYRPGAEGGPCLVPENSDANRFTELQRHQMRDLRQWPAATNPGRTVEMEWTLRENGKPSVSVGMLEFGGETFRDAFRGDNGDEPQREAVKDLLDYLASASSVIVLVSIKELLRDPAGRSPEEFERATESLWVTRGLLEFVRKRLPHAALVIGLTQADRYRAELDAAGGAANLFAAKWPTVRAAAPDVPVIDVASVSAVDEDGRPAPDYTTDGIEPIMSEVFRQRKSRHGSGRRTLLLLILLLAAGGYYASTKIDLVKSLLPKPEDSMIISKPTYCHEPTNAVASVTKPTNAVASVTEPTNAIASVTEPTNDVAATATTNAIVKRETPPAADVTSAATNAVAESAAVEPPAAASPQEVFASRLARAEAGDVKCQRWLGHQYYSGAGVVKQDLAEARRFYTKASEGGDARAQVCLAVMCEKGEGGTCSQAEAIGWFRKAAENGIADAQYRMGTHAWENRDANTNAIAEAKVWFDKARLSGCKIPNLNSWIIRVAAEIEKQAK